MVMLSPSIIHFFHLFQEHEPVICSSHDIHIHQEVQDCEICHFHQASFNYDLFSFPEFINEEVSEGLVEAKPILGFSIKPINIQLRAPPQIFS